MELGVGYADRGAALTIAETARSTEAESVDATVNDDGLGPVGDVPLLDQVRRSTSAPATASSSAQIISVGEADGVVRRRAGHLPLDLAPPATTLFTRASYVECTATVPAAGSDPAAGC